MRMRRMPDIKEGAVNVTPLIDVVMCLIIFFMLVAKIGVDTGADQRISIPASLQGFDIKDMGNTLTLNVQPGPLDQPMVTALVEGVVQEVKTHSSRSNPSTSSFSVAKIFRASTRISSPPARSINRKRSNSSTT